MKRILNALVVLFVGVGVGFFAARHTTPERVVTIEKEKVRVDKDVVTVIKEVLKKDGTKETVTTIADKSKETKDTATKTITENKAQYKVDLFTDLNDYHKASIQRRIFGGVFAGVWIDTTSRLGVSIGLEF